MQASDWALWIEPLEEEINTIEGLKELRSTAQEQVGYVTAEFELWRDIDVAAQDVRDRVNRARRELPDEVEAELEAATPTRLWPVGLVGTIRLVRERFRRYPVKRVQGAR